MQCLYSIWRRLLAEDRESGRFFLHQSLQKLRHGERLQLGVGLHEDRAVGAEGERGAQRLLACRNAARDHHELARRAGFLQAHGLLDRDLLEGVHRHLDVGGLDAAAIALHAHLDVEVDDALDAHQDFHGAKIIAAVARSRIIRRPTT